MPRSVTRRKFDEIVAFAEIEKFIDTPVKHYSSGMYVRLAFAVAAHLEPDILIVDEVLAVGDVAFQKKCLARIGDVGRSGSTVLVVSHNMPSILNLCERAILLDRGAVIQDGPAKDVVAAYLASAREAAGEVVWTDPQQAPGNDLVRLHAVRILQEGAGGPTADVDISKPIDVELEYWNLKEGAQIYPAIWLKDQMGTFVLSSSNHKSISLAPDEWDGRPHPVGLYRSICRIPGTFLNEGLYSIAAIVGKGVSDTLILQDYVVSFTVHDTGEMRGEYLGSWAGPVVRPRLAWRTAQVDEREEVTARVAESGKWA
jgi:lipopolysaccharide transport system ATP-binding protein